jgi:hypothetical protein
MKAERNYKFKVLILTLIQMSIFPLTCKTQDNQRQIISYEDYAESFIEKDDAYLATLEEWQNIIEQWLEKPVCLNNEEADWLAEYKIISLYQLNKLKEYRFIYGKLLSVYELGFIDGWDFQTVRKVMPLVTVNLPKNSRTYKKFTFRSLRQNLILKTAFNSAQSKGYDRDSTAETGTNDPYYTGSPVRLAIRYDLEYRNKLAFGLRMEKDPGEPFLIPTDSSLIKIKAPDLCSGYLLIKRLGPIQSVILGNYRVNFGYGVNLSGGFSGIEGRNGMSGMANRIAPQTSVSESGFFRGAAVSATAGRFSLTGFASMQNQDGTSVITDSLTGRPISFSSINKSGLHRSLSELSGRKKITEKVIGGFLVFQNNWLKTGIIGILNQFNAEISKSTRPYARFGLSGRENLVAGFSATIWLKKLQWLAEASVSRNKSKAILTGVQLTPVPGALISLIYRKFDVDYQNLYGSGFISAGHNADETGIRFKLRLELPKKYLLEIMADDSRSQWISYDLTAPSRQKEINITTEKAWPQDKSVCLTFRYINSPVKNITSSAWVCHTASQSQYRIRLEGRIEAMTGVRLKSRIECNLVQGMPAGWLILQDIEIASERLKARMWLRTCLFDVKAYESRIYAYENDVLYDFSSTMHYGKGLRGVLMFKFCPAGWMDLWLRLSTIYYTNKNIGTGWEEIDGNRQNEIELQARLRWPG